MKSGGITNDKKIKDKKMTNFGEIIPPVLASSWGETDKVTRISKILFVRKRSHWHVM